jgi:hypothetical protein
MLKNMCGNEYFEYETERYQLSNNLLEIGMNINNDIYNKKNYILYILIISIIITIVISITFTTLFFNNFIGVDATEKCTPFNNKEKDPTKLSSFKQFILCFCPWCGDLTDCTLSYILLVIILIFLPLVVILYLLFGIELYSYKSSYKYYIIAFYIILIIYRLPISYLDNFRYSNKNNSIILYYIFLIAYILCIGFIYNIIDLYFNYLTELETSKEDKYGKRYNDIYLFYRDYKDKINENDKDTISIFSDILKNILGLNYFTPDIKSINKMYSSNNDEISYYLYYTGIFLLFIYIVYIIIYKVQVIPSLIIDENDGMTLYNRLLIPVFALFVILLITNTNTLFNSYIKKYIVYEPLKLYKNDIFYLNKSFDKIIEKDNNPLKDPSPVKPRIGGTILTELYSIMFNYNLLDTTTNRDTNSIELNTNISFEISDTNDVNYINDDNNRYNIRKYISTNTLYTDDAVKFYDLSIFIGTDGDNNFVKLISNVYPIIKSDILTENTYKVKENTHDLLLEEIKNNIKAALCNVYIGKRNPDGTKLNSEPFKYILRNNKTYILTDDNPIGNRSKDNELYDEVFKDKVNDYKQFLTINAPIIDNVSNEYVNGVRAIVDMINNMFLEMENCGSCTNMNNIHERMTLLLSTSNDRLNNIKLKYKKKIFGIILDTYDNINMLLQYNRSKRDANPLTKYIIANYNSIKDNEYYPDNTFKKINVLEPVDTTIEKPSLDYTTSAENVYLSRLSNTETLEKNSLNISNNANTVSNSIIILIGIYLFVLLEPLYVES